MGGVIVSIDYSEERVEMDGGRTILFRKYEGKQSLLDGFINRNLSDEQAKDLLFVLQNCGSCSLLRYEHRDSEEMVLCKDCILGDIHLILPETESSTKILNFTDNEEHNDNLGYLLSLLFKNMGSAFSSKEDDVSDIPKVTKGEKLPPEQRKRIYMKYWVNAEVKASKTWLSERTGVSSRQITRDFQDMGIEP